MVIIQKILKGNIGGLDTKSDELNIPENASPSLNGVAISQNGSISSFPGRVVTVPSNAGDGKLAGRPVKYQTIYMDDSGSEAVEVPILYADNGTTAEWFKGNYTTGVLTSLGTVTAGGKVSAFQFNNDLIIFSSAHIPKVSSSLGAIGNLSGFPPDYVSTYSATYDLSVYSRNPNDFSVPTMPYIGESHVNSVWAASRDLIMKSVLFKSTDWESSDTNFLRHWWNNLNPSDNLGDIVNIKRWNDWLSIFKQRGIYVMPGTHPTSVAGSNPFTPIKTPSSKGLSGQNALDSVLNDLVFLDNDGYLDLLQSEQQRVNARITHISERVQSVFDSIPKDELVNVIVKTFPAKRQVWIAYNRGASDSVDGQNDSVAIWDYALNNFTKIEGVIKPASILVHNNNLYVGTYDGAIHKQYSGVTHGLTERVCEYSFPWFGIGGNDFNIPSIDLVFAGATSGTLLVQVIFENGQEQYYSITFSINEGGVYDVSNWDEVYYSAGSGRQLIKKTIYPNGYGNKCQIKLYSNTENFAWTFLEGVVNINSMGNSEV